MLLLLLVVSRPVSAALPLDKLDDEALRTAFRQVGLQVMFGDSLNAMVNANRLGWEVFNRRNDPNRMELQKYCSRCQTHTLHRETK